MATFEEVRPDAVVHLGAIVGVAASLAAPGRTISVNVHGSVAVFEAMRAFGVRRVVHLSSVEVYGDFERPVVDEQHPIRPILAYGISKAAVERFGATYGLLHGLECVNLRGTWIYGPELPRVRLPNDLFDAALDGRPFHLGSGAASVMDFLHVDDAVAALVAALDHPAPAHGAYNLGRGAATSLPELVDFVRTVRPDAVISVGPGHLMMGGAVRMRTQGTVDLGLIRRELGFAPTVDLAEGWRRHAAARAARS
jgi:nucleoside-diphosphate-sugar epimerase